MANIAKREDGRWRARYRDARGKEHARHFARKIDAQQWIDSVTTAVRTGSYVDPNDSRIRFADWAPRWLATKVNLKETTRATYENLLQNHVLPDWQTAPLADITHESVAAWVAELSKQGLSASTVRQIHRVFSLALDLAVRDGRLARNPCTGVPLPRAGRVDQVYLTHDQVDALATRRGRLSTGRAVPRLHRGALRRAGRTADPPPRLAAATRDHRRGGGRGPRQGRSSARRRTTRAGECPIPRFMIDDLAALVAGRDPDDFVFTAPLGGVLRLRNFRRAGFEPAVKAAGLSGITPHSLRHTAASLAIAAGANVKVVQTMLGHKSATMTLDLYGHLFDDQLDEVADAMDSARAAADFLRTKPAVVHSLR